MAFLAALPMVHEALEKIVEAFPDFRYYPPKELNVHYYPEKMTADELAAAMDQLAEDFDSYDYHDNFSPGGRYGGNCRIGIKMRLCP